MSHLNGAVLDLLGEGCTGRTSEAFPRSPSLKVAYHLGHSFLPGGQQQRPGTGLLISYAGNWPAFQGGKGVGQSHRQTNFSVSSRRCWMDHQIVLSAKQQNSGGDDLCMQLEQPP